MRRDLTLGMRKVRNLLSELLDAPLISTMDPLVPTFQWRACPGNPFSGKSVEYVTRQRHRPKLRSHVVYGPG